MNSPFKRLLASLAVAAAAATAGAVMAAESPAPVENGVWQKHDMTFQYMGFTSIYSCDGLVDKLKQLLLLSGARSDAKSRVAGCTNISGGPDRMAGARLQFYTLTQDSSAKGDAGQGVWRDVKLASVRSRDLEPGDCELVEQFRDMVLKKMFTVRNLQDNVHCIPHQVVGAVIDLKFQVLAAPVPAPKTK